MSLRFVHIFFIIVSDLLCTWVGAWGIQKYLVFKDIRDLLFGAGFFTLSGVLILYLVQFVKKSKDL